MKKMRVIRLVRNGGPDVEFIELEDENGASVRTALPEIQDGNYSLIRICAEDFDPPQYKRGDPRRFVFVTLTTDLGEHYHGNLCEDEDAFHSLSGARFPKKYWRRVR